MSVVIEQDSTAVVGNGVLSYLVAAHNPIRTIFRRMDDVVKSSTDDGYGNTLLSMQSNAPANLSVGDLIYINDGDNYVGVFTVIQILNATDFIIDCPYGATMQFAYLNYLSAYKNYFLRIAVTRVSGMGVSKPLGSSIVLPFSDGRAEHDLMSYAKISVKPTDAVTELGQTNVFWCDNDNNCILSIEVYENFNGVEFESAALEYSYIIANAAMSYNHKFGVNIGECYSAIQRVSGGLTPARWFFPYSKLRVWEFLPQFVAFIHFGGGSIVYPRIEYKKYRNGNLISGGATYTTTNTIDTSTSNGNSNYIHGIALDVLTNWGTADTMTVQIANNNNYQEKYSELLTLSLSCTPKNPVALRALNRYGGWSYYVFGIQQTVSVTTKIGSEFSFTPQSTLEINSDSYLLGKTANKEMLVGADDLDNDDLIIVKEILMSPCVQMYMLPEDYRDTEIPTSWMEVKIASGGYVIQNTKSNLHKVEFKIIFSEYNLPTR